MIKKIIFFIFLILKINSDFVEDNYYDLMNCMGTDETECTSVKLKTKNLECCRFDITTYSGYYNNRESTESICSAVFTNYVSQDMMKQIESIAIEQFGILEVYLDIDIPRIKEKITCSKNSATYNFGDYNYTQADKKKLKSENHCLYYYFNSIGENLFNDKNISISKDKCINAESLDITKNSDIYCAYADVAILYSDGTKNEFKTCYFLPSESIKSKQLDPTTEAALKKFAETEADKNKVLSEYEAKLVDKNGRSLTYNSNKGVIDSSRTSNSKFNSVNIFMIFTVLMLLF
jgi:hypothetical protein